jgi:glycosyltransferase involved in cell wall biosynthesis
LLDRTKYDVLLVKDAWVLPEVFSVVWRANYRPRVICDMYEYASAQIEAHRQFGSPAFRVWASAHAIQGEITSIEWQYLRQCDQVIVVIEEAKDALAREYCIDPKRIEVVHNVPLLSSFDSVPPVQRKAVVSYVGGMGAHRGVAQLIEASRPISKCFSDTNRPFGGVVLVGGTAKERERLEAHIARSQSSDVCLAIGRVSHWESIGWIKASAVGVIPHRDCAFMRKTIPNKIFQYMAAGVPVVVTDGGPMARIVKAEQCGCVFRDGDPKSLADAVNRVLAMPDAGQNGRRAVAERYNWERESSVYVDIASKEKTP